MSKQCLDVQQIQHLQELGLELDYNTMLSWIVDERGKDNPLLCISSEAVDYVDLCKSMENCAAGTTLTCHLMTIKHP